MAFYALDVDNFEDLNNERVFPSLICRKNVLSIPIDGTPTHTPSRAEDQFAILAKNHTQGYAIRREVLLAEICEVDSLKLADLVQKKHKSRVSQWPSITSRAETKLAGRIGNKRSDFLFFNSSSGALDFAVEVDGKYHLEKPQPSWDYSKNLIFLGLGVALMRVSDDVVLNVAAIATDKERFDEFKSMMGQALKNWNTFKQKRTVASMQLHHSSGSS